MSNPDLELVETASLLDELSRRFDYIACIGVRSGEDNEDAVVHYRGDSIYMLMGVVERLKFRIHNDIDADTIKGVDV